jgi:hypothetical protein
MGGLAYLVGQLVVSNLCKISSAVDGRWGASLVTGVEPDITSCIPWALIPLVGQNGRVGYKTAEVLRCEKMGKLS